MEIDRIYSAYLRKKYVALQVKGYDIGTKFGPCKALIIQPNVTVSGRKRSGHEITYWDYDCPDGKTSRIVDSRNIVGLWTDINKGSVNAKPTSPSETYEVSWTQQYDAWVLQNETARIQKSVKESQDKEIYDQKVRIEILLSVLGIIRPSDIASRYGFHRKGMIEIPHVPKHRIEREVSTYTALEMVLRYAVTHKKEIFEILGELKEDE